MAQHHMDLHNKTRELEKWRELRISFYAIFMFTEKLICYTSGALKRERFVCWGVMKQHSSFWHALSKDLNAQHIFVRLIKWTNQDELPCNQCPSELIVITPWVWLLLDAHTLFYLHVYKSAFHELKISPKNALDLYIRHTLRANQIVPELLLNKHYWYF